MTEDEFAAHTNVSRETLEFYRAWQAALVKWNARINLVAPNSLQEFWMRHALDSWQVSELVPVGTQTALDLGSGGGFPGLAIAVKMKLDGVGRTILVESVGKKASFLKTVIRQCALPAEAKAQRVEALDPQQADVITARAFAPLPKLLEYAAPHLSRDGILILPKGQHAQAEVEKALEQWTFDVKRVKSLTDPEATILHLSHLELKLTANK